jgi:hypothetical protein
MSQETKQEKRKDFWTLRQDGKIRSGDNGGDVARTNACFFISLFDGLNNLASDDLISRIKNVDTLCQMAGWTENNSTTWDGTLDMHKDAAIKLSIKLNITLAIYHIGITKVGIMETGHYLAEPEFIGNGSLVIPMAKFPAHFELLVKGGDVNIKLKNPNDKRLWHYTPGLHDPDAKWNFSDESIPKAATVIRTPVSSENKALSIVLRNQIAKEEESIRNWVNLSKQQIVSQMYAIKTISEIEDKILILRKQLASIEEVTRPKTEKKIKKTEQDDSFKKICLTNKPVDPHTGAPEGFDQLVTHSDFIIDNNYFATFNDPEFNL